MRGRRRAANRARATRMAIERGDDHRSCPRLDGMTFLVVDDHPDRREILAMFLGSEGGVVRTASAAEEGLELFKAAPSTAVITDPCMRRTRDGVWLLQQIRCVPAGRVPVIAVSGSRLQDEAAIGDAARFDARLLEPVDPDVLVEAITRLTKRRSPPS